MFCQLDLGQTSFDGLLGGNVVTKHSDSKIQIQVKIMLIYISGPVWNMLLPCRLVIGLFLFETCLQSQKVDIQDLIEHSGGTEHSTVQRSSHAVAEHILTCTHTYTRNH